MSNRVVAPDLSREEILRYSRHLVMPEIGIEGQQRLKGARVLCVGAGGLGSPASMYLAAAGIGTLGLVDFDLVEFSNLHRQILYGTPDVGRSKLASARARLSALNPEVHLELHETQLSSANALEIVPAYDVVVDGTDNFATRYLVNDACVLVGRPNVYGSIFRFEGQASVFAIKTGPCYRCLHPEPPPAGLVPNCAEGGVLGVLPGVIGTIQATETIKLLLGIGEPLVGRFLIYDALRMKMRELRLRKDPDCPVCGERPTIRALADYEQLCGPVSDREAAPVAASRVHPAFDMPVLELKDRLEVGDAPFMLDVREPRELEISRIAGVTLIPLGDLPHRLDELPTDCDIVVICRSGSRSARAAGFLRERGFPRARNLKGGMLAWADQVDPTQRKY